MNLVIELLNREKDFITNLKSCKNADAQELQMLAEINQALQLLQSFVVGQSEQLCDFEHHNADVRRACSCSECGGRKLK